MAYAVPQGGISAPLAMMPPQKKKPTPVEDMYKVYNAAVKQQGGDYDDIMGRFRSLYSDPNSNFSSNRSLASEFTPYVPELAQYSKSPDTVDALSKLRGLSETGGLSEEDTRNLRARGVSPIRAMYSTAQRDMDRQRRLSGGYSPNYGAVTSRMTRDMSSQVADQMDKVNAGIAEMVQKGKLSSAPQYANAAQQESELANRFSLENANAKNEAARFNTSNLFDLKFKDLANRRQDMESNNSNRMGILKGMTDLYGTTPALPALYGNQAMNTAQFQNNVNQEKKKTATNLLGNLVRR